MWPFISNKKKSGSISGFTECAGRFWIVGQDGRPIPGVAVFYRVGEDDCWIPCGFSGEQSSVSGEIPASGNFHQVEPIFFHIGELISWKFTKEGYVTQIISRQTTGEFCYEKINSRGIIELESA